VTHTSELEDPGDGDAPRDMLDDLESQVEETSAVEVHETDRSPGIEAELRAWTALHGPDRQSALKDVIAGCRSATPEILVHLCSMAHSRGDRPTLILAFEALCKTATPLLLSQAWGLSPSDRQDQVQEILLSLFQAIQEGKSGYAASRFASFAKRKSISLYRKRAARFEGTNQRIEPDAEQDPLDRVADRIPSAEARALLQTALLKLPERHRAVFIQCHIMEMTQPEIAAHHNISVRTVYSLLKEAEVAAGLTGDTDDC
jgi:RNA polymerase sigma factor (sigma-70 family)